MAKRQYDGTKEGSPTGWQVRFHSEFTASNGDIYRVEIIDSGGDSTRAAAGFSGTGSQPFLLGADGATVVWNGASDDFHAPFLESEMTVDMVVEGTYHRQLFTQISQSEQDRFGAVLMKFVAGPNSDADDPDGEFEIHWAGLLQHEQIEFVDHESNELLRLTFTDGLSRLNDAPFLDDNGDAFDGALRLSEIVQKCLGKIPTSPIFGYLSESANPVPSSSTKSKFLREDVYYLTEELDDVLAGAFSTLMNVRTDANVFYQIERSDDGLGGRYLRREAVSCGEVLRNVLSALRMRISMSQGWKIQNPASQHVDGYFQVYDHIDELSTNPSITVGTPNLFSEKVIDLDDENIAPLRGLSTRFISPAQHTLSVHTKAGSHRLLGPPQQASVSPTDMGPNGPSNFEFNGYTDAPYNVMHADDASATTLKNEVVSITGGEPIFIKFNAGNTLTGWGGDSSVHDDFVGATIVLYMVIKVGDYYLKRSLVSADAADDITIDGHTSDFRGWVQDGDVEWTTDVATYNLVVPFQGATPEPPVVLQGDDNEIQRVGGLHLALHPDEDKFEFSNGWLNDGTLQSGLSFPVEWAPPALPSGTHVGIEFKCVARYYRDSNSPIGQSVLRLRFEEEGIGNTAYYTSPNFGPVMKLGGFGIFSSEPGEVEDVVFGASQDDNSATLIVAESVLGDTYGTASAGALQDRTPGGTDWEFTGSSSWRTIDNTDTHYLHKLNALEALRENRKPVRVFTGGFAHDPSSKVAPFLPGNRDKTIQPHRPVRLSVTEGATAVDYDITPLALTWTVLSGVFELTGAVLNVDRTLAPDEGNNVKDSSLFGSSGANVSRVPNHKGNTATVAIANVKGSATTAQTVTDLITVANNKITGFDMVDSAIPPSKIETDQDNQFISTQLKSTIGTDATARLVTDQVTTTLVMGQRYVTAINASGSSVLNTNQISESGSLKKFTTSDERTKLDAITLSGDDISDIRTPSGALSAQDLYAYFINGTCPAAFSGSNACAVYNLPAHGTDRTGQTGDKVLSIGSDGSFNELADGSKGARLTTSGTGVLSWNTFTPYFLNGGAQLAYPYSRYLPLTGYIVEQNTASSNIAVTGFVCPHDGYIAKVIARAEQDIGNTSLTWYKAVDGTNGPATLMQAKTVDMETPNTSYTFSFSQASTGFSKGNLLSLKVDPTTDPTGNMDFNYIVLFQFDFST